MVAVDTRVEKGGDEGEQMSKRSQEDTNKFCLFFYKPKYNLLQIISLSLPVEKLMSSRARPHTPAADESARAAFLSRRQQRAHGSRINLPPCLLLLLVHWLCCWSLYLRLLLLVQFLCCWSPVLSALLAAELSLCCVPYQWIPVFKSCRGR